MKNNTKLSARNAFSRLKPKQARLVQQWLFEDNLSYDEILRRCARDFGIKATSKPLFAYHRHLREQRTVDRIIQNMDGDIQLPQVQIIAPVELGAKNELRKLEPEQAKKVEQWLFEDNFSQAEVIRRCARDFGIRTSANSVFQFYRMTCQNRTVDQLRHDSQKQQAADKKGAPAGAKYKNLSRPQMYEKMLKGGGSLMLAKLDGEPDAADHANIRGYAKLFNDARRQDIAENRLEWEKKKFQFRYAELSPKKAAQVMAISSRTNIPYKEKIRLIRLRLFGSAPDRTIQPAITLPAPLQGNVESTDDKTADAVSTETTDETTAT